MRTWHGATPNHTDRHRVMVSMGHNYRKVNASPATVKFERGYEELLEHPVLATAATTVDPPINYLHPPHPQNVLQRETLESLPTDGAVGFSDLSRQGLVKREGYGLGSKWRKYE